jgi:hypothetical protein
MIFVLAIVFAREEVRARRAYDATGEADSVKDIAITT